MRWFFWWRPPVMLRACIVNLKDGQAMKGVLWQSRGPWLTFRNCVALVEGQPTQPIDGDVVVHRSNLLFLQVPE